MTHTRIATIGMALLLGSVGRARGLLTGRPDPADRPASPVAASTGHEPPGAAPLPEIPAAGDEATRVTLLTGGQSRGTGSPPIPPGRSDRPRIEDVGAAPGHRALAAGDA